jgi:hypothetical protein
MTEYTVGLRLWNRSQVLTIEAEDAALKVKHNHPEALISYVRKSKQQAAAGKTVEVRKLVEGNRRHNHPPR